LLILAKEKTSQIKNTLFFDKKCASLLEETVKIKVKES
jgi:hypothetical protein